MITVHCPSCNKAHQVTEATVGKRARCNQCAATFVITSESDRPPEPQLSVPTPGPRRSFGLVFIVFYWVIEGISAVLIGFSLALGSSVAERVAGDFSGPLSGLSGDPVLRLAITEFVGVIVFILGLFTLVADYGLWTYRQWGLQLARVLAVVYVVMAAIGLIANLYTRAGIVLSVAGLVVSVGVLYYLYGSLNGHDRSQQYWRAGAADWERFE